MDYAMLSEHHIQSITDQEEFAKTAHIAAAAPTAVLPEQSGIWAYPIKGDSNEAVAANIASAMLQRLYLSGQILNLDEDRIKLVKEGIDIHKSIRAEIANSIPFYPIGIPNHNSDIICLGFKYPNCSRIVLSSFDNGDREINIPIGCDNAKILYPSDTKITLSKAENGLNVTIPAECMSVIIEIK